MALQKASGSILQKITASILQYVTKCVALCNMDAVIREKLKNETIKTTGIVSRLLSHGIIAVTNEDLSVLLSVPENQIRQRLAPLVKRKEISRQVPKQR
jgi:hypothetical protein